VACVAFRILEPDAPRAVPVAPQGGQARSVTVWAPAKDLERGQVPRDAGMSGSDTHRAEAPHEAHTTPSDHAAYLDRCGGRRTGEVDAVRAGREVCWERVVVDIDAPVGGYRAENVEQVTADGSGEVVPTPGGARIQFVVYYPAHSLGVGVGQPVGRLGGFRRCGRWSTPAPSRA
jgi:hypothetical protein